MSTPSQEHPAFYEQCVPRLWRICKGSGVAPSAAVRYALAVLEAPPDGSSHSDLLHAAKAPSHAGVVRDNLLAIRYMAAVTQRHYAAAARYTSTEQLAPFLRLYNRFYASCVDMLCPPGEQAVPTARVALTGLATYRRMPDPETTTPESVAEAYEPPLHPLHVMHDALILYARGQDTPQREVSKEAHLYIDAAVREYHPPQTPA